MTDLVFQIGLIYLILNVATIIIFYRRKIIQENLRPILSEAKRIGYFGAFYRFGTLGKGMILWILLIASINLVLYDIIIIFRFFGMV